LKNKPTGIVDGVGKGGKALVTSLGSGISGFFKKPV